MKLFAAWVIALRERYISDLFFRTTAHIVGLLVVFLAVCVMTFTWAIFNPGSPRLVAFGILALFTLALGFLIARVTLRPARNALYYQKLFISNVAHELRTPLSTIKTSSEVALLDPRLSPQAKECFTDIVGELDRVSEISTTFSRSTRLHGRSA